MTTASLQRNPSTFTTNTVPNKFEVRLRAMEDHAFVKLNCEDRFERVGFEPTEWTLTDLNAALNRAPALASDPARGNKITDGGVEEAAVALTAEHLDIFETATRESTGGAEFIDNNNVAWDVKSPLSPPEGQNWEYSPDHQIVKIRKDLSQGDKVLFNLSRVNDKDRDDTLKLLTTELTCQERSQLVILTDSEIAAK